MIEVELRSFIDEQKYNELLSYFENNAISDGSQKQITSYFNCEQDLRLMATNDDYCQLWLKKGQLHEDAREELIVKVDKSYKDSLFKIFQEIGLGIAIKWFRFRRSFRWNEIKVDLDFTYGYGYIIEIEILAEDETKVDEAKEQLQNAFDKLGINITAKEVFKQKFIDYEKNWLEYTNGLTEEAFLNL